MKLDNDFIYTIILRNHDVNQVDHDISDEDHYKYRKDVSMIIDHIKQEPYNKMTSEIRSITSDILTVSIDRYIKYVQLMNSDKIDHLRHIINRSSYSDHQKDIYQGIIFYLHRSIKEPNKFSKTVHPEGSFSKYAMSRNYKKAVNEYTFEQLFNGMFDYPTTDQITYDSCAYDAVIEYLKNMKLTNIQIKYINLGWYVSEETLLFFQSWQPFKNIVHQQIKYLLFGYSPNYFVELHNYFEPQDIEQVPNIFVSDHFLEHCVMKYNTMEKLNNLITPEMKEHFHTRIRQCVRDKQAILTKKIEDLDKFEQTLME